MARLRQLGQDTVLFIAVASLLISALAGMARFAVPILVFVTAVLMLSGLLHSRSQGRGGGDRRSRRQQARLARANGNLGRCWFVIGVVLAFGLVLASPLIVALVGVLATLALAARARKLSLRRLGAGFGCTVVMLFCACGLYGAVAAAEVVSWLDRGGGGGGGYGGTGSVGGDGVSEAPDYADLCPALPDPLEISHGLGPLFRRDGAVEAGCGGPAENVAGNGDVWFSLGMCEGTLRSLAVSATATGGEPVLLYGEPAQFAWEAARTGELRSAEVAKPGSGDLDIVTTVDGSYVFARSSPSLRARSKKAKECAEIDEVARPFVMLPPPLAGLWFQDVIESGWTWPLSKADEPEKFVFFDEDLGVLEASGGCRGYGSCYFDPEEAPRRWSTGAAAVSLAGLSEFMPPEIG